MKLPVVHEEEECDVRGDFEAPPIKMPKPHWTNGQTIALFFSAGSVHGRAMYRLDREVQTTSDSLQFSTI